MFPIKKDYLTPNRYSRPQRPLGKVLGIVIHWTANEGRGADAAANRAYFENRKHGRTGYGSAHYIVDDQEILLCMPESELSYHVGAKSYKTSKFGSYPNTNTIGIEMCVNSDGNFKTMYQQTVELAAHLLKKHNLTPEEGLTRHYDITGKNCPGMFTSNHWGRTNNSYAQKYGLGNSADQAWLDFKTAVKRHMNPSYSNQPVDTSKGIGSLVITVPSLNIRSGPGFNYSVAKVASKGERYTVYGEQNGLYNLGNGLWVTNSSNYVIYKPHPTDRTEEAKRMFKDIVGHWAAGEIEELAKKGILTGKTDGTFDPNGNVNRAQLAAVISRTLDYIEKNIK